MSKPLSGIKVIELSTYVAAPITARMLGELGAEVIKVESHYGDDWRMIGATLKMPVDPMCNPNFDQENRDKKSISLNLKTPEGNEILHKLLKDADVLITNYRPEALEKLKMTYEILHELYPRLIFGQVVGYGPKGPDKDKPGFDLTAFWARSGFMIDPVEKDTKPMSTLVGVGDRATGMSLFAGINAALVKQIRTNQGERVVSGLYQNSLYLCQSHITASNFGTVYPKSHDTAVSPLVNSYLCKDGKWLLLAGTNYDKYWEQFCQLAGDERLFDEKFKGVKGMIANVGTIISLLDEVFLTKTQDEWERLLKEADIANEKILHWTDVENDEQAIANDYIYKAEYENGISATLVNTPFDIDSVPNAEFTRAPSLGENNVEILQSIGYSDEAISSLYTNKIIKG